MSDGLASTRDIHRVKIDLRVAIDRYEEEVVNPIILKIKHSFIKQVIFHSILILPIIVFTFIQRIQSPTNIIVSLAAVGGFIVANLPTARKTFERFQKDRRTLLESVFVLKLTLDQCSEDDEAGLKEVEALLRGYLEAFGS